MNSEIKRPHRSEKTGKRIEEAYLSLMLEKPWDKITVREICQKAELTRGTFYQYYNDIYDLVEQLESRLLSDLSTRYEKEFREKRPALSMDFFPERFDATPPPAFLVWFDFCRENELAMIPLLDRNKGDRYFVKKLRGLIEEHVSLTMDQDGMPRDELRSHFLHLISEIHFLAAQSWLTPGEEEDRLEADDIVNLLNTMRVGSVFLTWQNHHDRS